MNKKTAIIFLSVFLVVTACVGIQLIPKADKQNTGPSTGTAERVICLNPGATEIIFELGCQEKLVAVSDYCSYPLGTKNIATVGGAINPNLERISALKPDLVIVQGKGEVISKLCKSRNIECVSINLKNIEEIYEGITELGKKLGCPEASNDLNNNIREELEGVKKVVSAAAKKKVFFAFYRDQGSLSGLTTFGSGTFINELINIAGGVNIFSDLGQHYPVISKETLLKRQPEIIIEPFFRSRGEDYNSTGKLKDWAKLDQLDAVINEELYIIDSSLFLIPGPRIGQAAFELANIIHPELFDESNDSE